MFPSIRDTIASDYEKSLVVVSHLASLTDNLITEDEITNSLLKLRKTLGLGRTNPHYLTFHMRKNGDIEKFYDGHPLKINLRYFRLRIGGLHKVDHAIYKGSLLEQEVRDSIANVADEVVKKSNMPKRHYFGERKNIHLGRYVSFDKQKEK